MTTVRTVRVLNYHIRLRLRLSRSRRPTVYVRPTAVTGTGRTLSYCRTLVFRCLKNIYSREPSYKGGKAGKYPTTKFNLASSSQSPRFPSSLHLHHPHTHHYQHLYHVRSFAYLCQGLSRQLFFCRNPPTLHLGLSSRGPESKL